jgi:hypothetical protein
MTAGFEENQLGQLSREQQHFLLSELAVRVAVIGLIGIPIAVNLVQTAGATGMDTHWRLLGWLILIGAVGMGTSFLWMYGRDLYIHKPVRNSGIIKKYRRKRLRGLDFYCIKIEKHQFFNPEVLTTGEVWHTLHDGQSYELYFARNTKWLLSWCEINSE